MTSFALRIVAGVLLFLAVALAFSFGVGGSAETVLRALYGPIVDSVEWFTLSVFSKEMWDIVVKPLLGWPSWIFPLLLAALTQSMSRRRARRIG